MKNIELKCYDCYQSAIATVARFFNHDYQIVALGRIGFKYDEDMVESIGTKIHPYEYRKFDDFWELIGISQHEYILENDSEQIFKEHLKNNQPILLWADLYDCYWNLAFNKYHFPHCYLLNGYEKNKENVVFSGQDSFFDTQEIKQTFGQIRRMTSKYNVFEVYKKQYNYYEKIFDEVKKDAEYYFLNESGMNIGRFAEDLQRVNFEKENKYGTRDLYAVPLIDNLKIVGDRRKAYFVMIKFLSNVCKKNMYNILEGLNSTYKKWEVVRIILIKKMMSGEKKLELDLVHKLLNEIIVIEESIFEEILKNTK